MKKDNPNLYVSRKIIVSISCNIINSLSVIPVVQTLRILGKFSLAVAKILVTNSTHREMSKTMILLTPYIKFCSHPPNPIDPIG